jgi:hypothetical protein
MSVLPAQVEWRRFVCVLRKLGYVPQKGKAGSARIFVHPERHPNSVSFREPHSRYPLGRSALRGYLQKLGLEADEFLQLLADC